jgi:AAA ATPase domain
VLVGRRDELAALDTFLDRVQDGRGGVVIVVGEAGIGKTRLLAEAVVRAHGRRLTVLRGRAVEGGGAYRAVAEAVAGAVRDDRLAQRDELRAYRVALSRLIPGWARPGDGPGPAADPTVVLGEGLLRLSGLLGGADGCLLVLEDLHWANADTVALLEYLAGAAGGWPVVIAASARDESSSSGETGRLTGLDDVTVLRLNRLSARTTQSRQHGLDGRALVRREPARPDVV